MSSLSPTHKGHDPLNRNINKGRHLEKHAKVIEIYYHGGGLGITSTSAEKLEHVSQLLK